MIGQFGQIGLYFTVRSAELERSSIGIAFSPCTSYEGVNFFVQYHGLNW